MVVVVVGGGRECVKEGRSEPFFCVGKTRFPRRDVKVTQNVSLEPGLILVSGRDPALQAHVRLLDIAPTRSHFGLSLPETATNIT